MVEFGIYDVLPPRELITAYPGITISRVFMPGVRTPDDDLVDRHRRLTRDHYAAGLTPMISVKLDPVSVVRGAYDRAVDAYAAYLADALPTKLIYWHEPENDMTGAEFAGAFTRVRERIHDAAPSVPVGYAAMAYQWRPGAITTRTPAEWLVDADFYSVDAYSETPFPALATFDEHPGVLRWFDELVVRAAGADRWAITERGFRGRRGYMFRSPDRARAKTLDRESKRLTAFGASPLMYNFWNTPGAEHDSSLVSGPRTLAALRRMIATHSVA